MKLVTKLAICAGALVAVTATALAQPMPEMRDARTGKVWTPEMSPEQQEAMVNPNAPVNQAFDPTRQAATVRGTVLQRPRAQLMGTVPMLAGPTVPVVTLDLPSLQALPGRHWLSVLYVTNNSTRTVDIVVGCRFTNGGRPVEDTQVIIPPAGPGERLGVPVRGPLTDIFVDQVQCNVMSPI
jgi:hypothetical protein